MILLFRAGRSKAHGWEIGKQRGGCRSRSLRILHVGRMGYFRSTCSTVSMLSFVDKNFPKYIYISNCSPIFLTYFQLFQEVQSLVAHEIKITFETLFKIDRIFKY